MIDTIMNIIPIDRDELIKYIEMELLGMCDSIKPSINPDVVGTMYENAYNLLSRLDNTLETQQVIFRTQIYEKNS
jgi:hypothetical protein